jgi:hypothetical protein
MVHGYKLNDVAFSVDGSAALTSSSFTPPTGSWQLHLMTSANGLAGDVERVKIGMTKPTNTVIERMAGWVIT